MYFIYIQIFCAAAAAIPTTVFVSSSLLLLSSCLTKHQRKSTYMGSGCGSVGRAVASDARGPRFESRQRRFFKEQLPTVNCFEQTKIKEKGGRKWPI